MPTTYRAAPAVKRIAEKLIAEHHDHLDGVRIDYVFRDPTAKSKGAPIWASARKVGGLTAALVAGIGESEVDPKDVEFFVIEVAERSWGILSDAQKVGLIDHELMHCGVTYDDDGACTLSIRPHDLEEFRDIVTRHGLWTPGVADIATALVDAAGYTIPAALPDDESDPA